MHVRGMLSWVVRCGIVAARRVTLHHVPDELSSKSRWSAAQRWPCWSGGGGVWRLCYELRILEAVLLFGWGAVFRLEGGGALYLVLLRFSVASRCRVF